MKRIRSLARLVGIVLLALGAVAGVAQAETILFVGNSFTYGALSPVWKYRPQSVTDLNGGGAGGVPALFKLFTEEAGLDYQVSHETVGGAGLGLHLREKAALIDRAWDHVVLQGYSTLDRERPGDPTAMVGAAAALARLFHERNPAVDVRLAATWSRADLTYRPGGRWYGRPITEMARDIRRGYDQARAASPYIRGVAPVGEAWNRAIETGLADPNPYDGIEPEKLDLWAYDRYHASAYGYYLEALVLFGQITGRDPRTLGPEETAAVELGFSPAQTRALQQVAHDTLAVRP
jgi:hypothetical protein